jgi:cation diffusion facilitator CzcD-associated flavoprotein CzcO
MMFNRQKVCCLSNLEEKKKTVLIKALESMHEHNWLVWNPSQKGKHTIFDLASVPPKNDDSDGWDDDKMMVYKFITDENLSDMGLCLDEVKHYKAMPIFIVDSKDIAMKITALANQSEDKRWALMVVEGAEAKEDYEAEVLPE